MDNKAQEPLMYGDAIHKGLSCACKPAQEYLTRAQQVIRANNSAQEPVPLIRHENGNFSPAPSWQGLSDNKIISLYAFYGSDTEEAMLEFARAIEQALKEKNT